MGLRRRLTGSPSYRLWRQVKDLEDEVHELGDTLKGILERLQPTEDQLSVSTHGPTIESEYGRPAYDLTAPSGWRFRLYPGGHPVFRHVRDDDWYLQAGKVLTPDTRGAMSAMQYAPPGPRLILERIPESDVPSVESMYGRPVHELKVPYGWRFKQVVPGDPLGQRQDPLPEYRRIHAGDYYLTFGDGVGQASVLDAEVCETPRLILESTPKEHETETVSRAKVKALDRKFHIQVDDLNIRIVKTSNGEAIPDDEPLLLFRARDNKALRMLYKYRQWCVDDNCTEYQIDKIDQAIHEFEQFARTHPQRMKQPGCTSGM